MSTNLNIELDPKILYQQQISQIAKKLVVLDALSKEQLDSEILNHFPHGAPKGILPAVLKTMTELYTQEKLSKNGGKCKKYSKARN